MFAFELIAERKPSLMSARVEARYFRRAARKLGG
jgi:hypothetical protein